MREKKAGIIKKNIPVVIYPQEKEAYEVIKKKAKEMEAPLYEVNLNDGKIFRSFK